MSALKWAAVPIAASLFAGTGGLAVADAPPTTATAPGTVTPPDPTTTTPAATDPTATDPTVDPVTGVGAIWPGTWIVDTTTITATTTTTINNAPITVVAAPITTTTNTSNTAATSTTASTTNPATPNAATGTTTGTGPAPLDRLQLNLRGCGATTPKAKARRRVRHAQVRLAPQAQLVVRVNGRQVASLGLPAGRDNVALRVRLGKDGRLTISRPSGQILDVPACST